MAYGGYNLKRVACGFLTKNGKAIQIVRLDEAGKLIQRHDNDFFFTDNVLKHIEGKSKVIPIYEGQPRPDFRKRGGKPVDMVGAEDEKP